MKIRQSDTLDDELVEQIKAERDRKPVWIQAVVAAALAVASALGGYQVTQLSIDPNFRPDPFTGAMGRELEMRMKSELDDKIAAKTAFNIARWNDVSSKLELQHSTISTLAGTVQSMLSRCAEVQVRDAQMLEMIKDNRALLFNHLGIRTNGHKQPKE